MKNVALYSISRFDPSCGPGWVDLTEGNTAAQARARLEHDGVSINDARTIVVATVAEACDREDGVAVCEFREMTATRMSYRVLAMIARVPAVSERSLYK